MMNTSSKPEGPHGYKTKEGDFVEVTGGYVDEGGNYVPTAEECFTRWADIPKERDLSVDDFRMKIWRHPPTRNLIPFFTPEQARVKQAAGAKVRSSRIRKYKEDKEEKTLLVQIIKEEMNTDDDDLDPYALLQLRAKMAMMDEDWEKVEELAFAMLEYTKPKLARTEVKTEEIKTDSLTVEEMQSFLDGSMSMEEVLKKQGK